MFLDIIHRLVFIQNPTFRTLDSISFFTQNLLIWVQSPKIGISSMDWAQPTKFYLKTETESSLRNVFLNKYTTMDYAQKHNICTRINFF
jgi:hypothetical protein